MKVFDGAQFTPNPLLVSGGVKRKHMVYMDSFYPQPNPDYTKVPVERARSIGAMLESMGVTDAIHDIEYLPGAPESICWWMDDPAHRATALEMHRQTIAAVRENYRGSYGIYLWDSWEDWACAVIRDGSRDTEYVRGKFKKALQWEVDMMALSPYVDVIYPTAYFGGFAQYAIPNNEANWWYGLSYDQYLQAFKLFLQQTRDSIHAVHGQIDIQFYITNNAEGKPYPAGCWDDILRACKDAGVDAVAWNATAYAPKWSDFDCGLMVAHNDSGDE